MFLNLQIAETLSAPSTPKLEFTEDNKLLLCIHSLDIKDGWPVKYPISAARNDAALAAVDAAVQEAREAADFRRAMGTFMYDM